MPVGGLVPVLRMYHSALSFGEDIPLDPGDEREHERSQHPSEQRAVEVVSIIAISYYLIGIQRVVFESCEHAGLHVSPVAMLVSIPIAIAAVALLIVGVKDALQSEP